MKNNNNMWIGVVAAAAIVASIAIVLVFNDGSLDNTSASLAAEFNAEEDWYKGNPDSGVVLVEYSDFECPACAAREPLVEKMLEKYEDDIAFAYRHFPLSMHVHAIDAALAAEAAGQQGKFWEMKELLFENQQEWSTSGEAVEMFEGYAEELELDMEKYGADVESDELAEKVLDQKAGGEASRVGGTPTFYLNGEMLQASSEQEFEAAIVAAIEEAGGVVEEEGNGQEVEVVDPEIITIPAD